MKRTSILKKLCALALTAALSVSVFAACGNGGADSSADNTSSGSQSVSSEKPEESTEQSGTSGGSDGSSGTHTINMAIIGNEQPNQETVFAAVNDLMEQDIGMNIEFTQLGFGDYQERLNLMLSGGDALDILPIFYTLANSYKNAGQIVDLNTLIDEYGQDIVSLMGEDIAKSGSVGDFVYGLPANKEAASLAGVVMRKDIVDELQIDMDAIHTYDDLTPVFEKVKVAHPELDMISGTNLVNRIQQWDPLSDYFGVLMEDGQSTEVVNFFETEEYATRVKRVSDWYKAGYVKLDAATTTETAQNLVKAGSLFSYLSAIKPGFLVQENISCGTEMVTAYIGKDDGSTANMICTGNVNYFNWGIAQQSTDKEKSMQFLNYAYSSPEWNNLMNFGIEGEDYELTEGSDVVIDYPAGKDATSAYHLNMGWMLPNQFIGYVWNGQPEDIWQQYQDFNAESTYSIAFGFMYDSSSVSTELTALNSVLTEYQKPLETGSVSDAEATLKDFNDKLYAAGLQKVMDLKQEQLDEWLASN